jgi:hypothetical protein
MDMTKMSIKEKNELRTIELQAIIKPLEKFMNNYCCPHDILVIQQGRVELFEGALSIALTVID